MHLISKNINDGPTPVLLTKNTHPSFIGSWILDDLSICDRLIAYVEEEDARDRGDVGEGLVYSSEDRKKVVNKKSKISFDRRLSFKYEVCVDYSIELQKCLNMYFEEYPCSNDVGIFTDGGETGNVQKYPKGGGYFNWHCERSSNANSSRHLTYMTYLNDVTDAGETEFLHQKLKVKPKKGLTLIWPCDWTFFHRGISSQTQVKYIATGWYCFTD